MRSTPLIAASLLGVALLTAPSASAAGETCRGEAATIVGTGPTLQGTDGRDVIVAGTSINIAAGAGDDLICVASPVGSEQIFSNVFNVDAGAGNDLVDSTAMGSGFYLMAILGDGSDTLVGGAGDERVAAGAAAGFIWVDVPDESERDVIDTGDGSDSVVSGGPGLANEDDVRTGSGEDVVMWSGVMGAQSVLDAGADSDLLIAPASGQNFGIDLNVQKLSRNGAVEASFASIERLRVDPEPDLGTVDIVGTAGDDVVELHASASVRASLGGGDDNLTLAGVRGDSRIDLGMGTDRVTVRSTAGSVDLDLAEHVLVVDGAPAASLDGVENAYVSATKATVIGSDRANILFVAGCRATIDGGGGKDDIEHTNVDILIEVGYSCAKGDRVTLRGGPGNDEIEGGRYADRIYGDGGNDRIKTGPARLGKNEVWGGQGNDKIQGGGDNDVLSGGPGNDTLGGKTGRDVAIGGPDRDTCRAEVTRSCER